MNELTEFFVEYPFQLEDLKRPHLVAQRKPYVVEKTLELAEIDYENFITDLCVERWFIEKNARLCRVDDDGVWHCLFVRQLGKANGVLVMSEGRDFPKWAAYLDEKDAPR